MKAKILGISKYDGQFRKMGSLRSQGLKPIINLDERYGISRGSRE